MLATERPKKPTIASFVPIDNAVIVNMAYGSSNGANLSEINFTISDSSTIFSITKPLQNTSPTQFILSESDIGAIKNYKKFEMSVSVRNIRRKSDYSDAVEFQPTDIPNAPVLNEPVESDSKLTVSWRKPSDYAEWFVESYSAWVHLKFKDVNSSLWQMIELDV